MKKIIRLTESDLTRIVKRVIQEEGYPRLIDPSQFEFNDYNVKPFDDLLTTKYNFEYLKNNNGNHTYILKKDDCDVIVATQSSYDIGQI